MSNKENHDILPIGENMKKESMYMIVLLITIILGIVLIHQNNTYLITLVADNEIYKEIRIPKNTTWKENIKKEKEGYTFIGWYDEEEKILNNNEKITSNKVYYARWAKIVTDKDNVE